MRYLTVLISLVVLLNTWVLAAEVDFSKVYIVVPEATTQTEPIDDTSTDEVQIPPPPMLHICGVETTESHHDEVTVFNWKLLLGFNPNNVTFYVQDAQLQNHFEPQLLQQRLRGTIWKGDYKTAKNFYSTELRLVSVQNGFVGAEIIHRTEDEPEPSSFLEAKMAGDITTQYLIDEKGDGELVWVDVARYEEIVAQINKANEGKEGDEMAPIPNIINARHLIRLKRTREIGNSRHASSRWGSHNEYRFTVENDKIIGNVGSPPDNYGTQDVLTGSGKLELTISDPLETEPPLPE